MSTSLNSSSGASIVIIMHRRYRRPTTVFSLLCKEIHSYSKPGRACIGTSFPASVR